ncbi:Putative inner membrane protein [hydrothermal vent metagenome]|uniref:Inner membrane protein n=1 Tax=hydrothermal vent metagenome TaxID=652676 RepID=A0A3B1A3M8_9ZZZZ
MFKFISHWLDQRIIQRSEITEEQWHDAFKSLPLLIRLSEEDKQVLKELAILFLHHKSFEGAQGIVVSQAMALIIALQACLLILKLDFKIFSGWYSVIVYPSAFVTKRLVTDEAGVEHVVHSNLVGESWQKGPVVLAWDDTENAGIIDGHNLVIHEFAHKVDMQNGVANGFPPLHAGMDKSTWVEDFSTGFKDFQQKCERGKDIGINCYAASAPAEFFAVLSELFFERPDVIVKHYRNIYQQLRQYYRQDPLQRLE